jgi:hypothetical protein
MLAFLCVPGMGANFKLEVPNIRKDYWHFEGSFILI